MTYIKVLVLVVGVTLSNHSVFACACVPFIGKNWKAERVYKNIKESSLVFVGDVISLSDSTYTVKVLDVIKGEAGAATLVGYNYPTSSCSKSVTEGMWIIYTSLNENGYIPEIDGCSISRNLSNPEFSYVPPLPSEHLDSLQIEELVETQEQEQLPLHLKSWMNEYAILTAYRNQTKASETEEESGNNQLTYVALGVALIALLVALLKK
ncbi:hypothetical protein CLV24_13015 [Pontibacter ummariensis]|uniref:Tissue inhibitor of metalloproteinase n=1 Tax=Pontibacter ummariensis TaxID=1610492 RepID=A0A239KMP5_9BACT|nr:hypothetical protein [Pontibacter ummariensis]PRY05335.1 hypothetical protein CLV24_13015 [Pontibacter ummariensis]SNT19431.1 hypothetical protein SAMN06296052_13015 [Pontibacter ummariensis]